MNGNVSQLLCICITRDPVERLIGKVLNMLLREAEVDAHICISEEGVECRTLCVHSEMWFLNVSSVNAAASFLCTKGRTDVPPDAEEVVH